MPEDFDLNLDPGGTTQDPPPADPPPSDDLKAAIEAERVKNERLERQLADSQRRAEEANRYASEVAMRALDQNPAPTTKTPPATAPDPVEDPEAYANWQVETRVKAAIDERVKPLEEKAAQFEQARAVDVQTQKVQAREWAERNLPKWKDHEKDVDAYLAQFNDEALAHPHVLREAYHRVRGVAADREDREAATRSAAAMDAGGRPSASAHASTGEPSPPTLPPRAKRVAAAEGLDDSDWSTFKGDIMDIDEFTKWKEAKAAGGAK